MFVGDQNRGPERVCGYFFDILDLFRELVLTFTHLCCIFTRPNSDYQGFGAIFVKLERINKGTL